VFLYEGKSYTQEEINHLKMKHNAKPYNVQEQAKRIIQNEDKYQKLRQELLAQNVFTHVAAHEVLNKILLEWREEDEYNVEIENKKLSDAKGAENEESSQVGGVGLFRRLGEGVKNRINKVSNSSIPNLRANNSNTVESNNNVKATTRAKSNIK